MKMKEDIEKAYHVLMQGGIILYPTDTIWGIGCDATNSNAVERIYTIKQRKSSKSMLILLDNQMRLLQYIDEVPGIAWDILEVSDKPLTIIYPKAKNLAKNLLAEDGSVGIRLVQDELCLKIIQRLKKPIVSTSANYSGHSEPKFFFDIDEGIINSVDYVVKYRQEDSTYRKPSGIIKLGLKGEVKVIRE